MYTIIPSYLSGYEPVSPVRTDVVRDHAEQYLPLTDEKDAAQVLLPEAAITFRRKYSDEPARMENAPAKDRLDLILDSRTTADLLLQNRGVAFRQNLILMMSYTGDFDPMIATDSRYAYDELDWGYTEQPFRQVQAIVQLQGGWADKQKDLLSLLSLLSSLSPDAALASALSGAHDRFAEMDTGAFSDARNAFDAVTDARAHLLENLMVYEIHRHYTAFAAQDTILPAVQFAAVTFAAVRSLLYSRFVEKGSFSDEDFARLVSGWSRAFEEDEKAFSALLSHFRDDPLFSRDRLVRMLWR